MPIQHMVDGKLVDETDPRAIVQSQHYDRLNTEALIQYLDHLGLIPDFEIWREEYICGGRREAVKVMEQLERYH